MKRVAFFSLVHATARVVRRRKVDMAGRPVLADDGGSTKLSALKIGGIGTPYLPLLPSSTPELPGSGGERRSHLERQRL